MERRVKERLIGAVILVALVVLLVPEFLRGPHPASVAPAAPDPENTTRTYWVDAAHVNSAPPASQPPSASVAVPEAAPAPPPAASPSLAAPPQAAARAPLAATAAAARPTATGGWTVQLGSFAKKANADSLVRQLKTEGFNVYISSIGTAAAQRYRVRIGPIADRGGAAVTMAKLQALKHSPTLLPPSE